MSDCQTDILEMPVSLPSYMYDPIKWSLSCISPETETHVERSPQSSDSDSGPDDGCSMPDDERTGNLTWHFYIAVHMADQDKTHRKNLTIDDVLSMIGEPISSGDENDTGYRFDIGAEENANNNIEELMTPSLALDMVDSLRAQAESAIGEDSIESQSDVDDTDRDVNYEPEDEVTADSETDDNDEEFQNDNSDNNNDVNKHVRQKRALPATWKQNTCKKKRLSGMPYTTTKGKLIERKMGPPCKSTFCEKSKDRHCQSINEDQRSIIFNDFWSKNSWEERKTYIRAIVDKVDIKQNKAGVSSRRLSSFAYNLKLPDRAAWQVCKPLFASTFGVSERTLMSWLTDTKEIPKKSGPKSGNCAKLTDEETHFLSDWLQGLPTVDSHYCRNTPTYKEKKFLHPGTTISKLHREYKLAAETAGVKAVSVAQFSKVFHEHKYCVFIPRKDQCDVCVPYKHSNISKDE